MTNEATAVTDVPEIDFPQFRYLQSFKDMVRNDMDESLQSIQQMFRNAGNEFEGLDGQIITVGVTHPEISYHGEPWAMADPYNKIIYFQPDAIFEGYQTIFHELMHLQIREELEAGKDVPKTSEAYCSIRTIAAMPPDMLYRDDIAYLGEPEAPKDDWPEICERALEYREDHRNYIQKCKEWLQINE